MYAFGRPRGALEGLGQPRDALEGFTRLGKSFEDLRFPRKCFTLLKGGSEAFRRPSNVLNVVARAYQAWGGLRRPYKSLDGLRTPSKALDGLRECLERPRQVKGFRYALEVWCARRSAQGDPYRQSIGGGLVRGLGLMKLRSGQGRPQIRHPEISPLNYLPGMHGIGGPCYTRPCRVLTALLGGAEALGGPSKAFGSLTRPRATF